MPEGIEMMDTHEVKLLTHRRCSKLMRKLPWFERGESCRMEHAEGWGGSIHHVQLDSRYYELGKKKRAWCSALRWEQGDAKFRLRSVVNQIG